MEEPCYLCEELFDYGDFAYIGPLNLGSTSCNPFDVMIHLCQDCVEKLKEDKGYNFGGERVEVKQK